MSDITDSSSAGKSLPLYFAAGVLAIVVALGFHYSHQANSEGNGNIQLGGVRLEFGADVLLLQANANVNLPSDVHSGLDSGVPLIFVVQLDVQQGRTLWFPKRVYSGQMHYTVTYYELTRHYRISSSHSTNQNANQRTVSRNYRSLSSAIAGLGELENLNFSLDEQQLQLFSDIRQNNTELEGVLSMRLSTSTLPLSLQPIFRSSWKLASEEYRWSIS